MVISECVINYGEEEEKVFSDVMLQRGVISLPISHHESSKLIKASALISAAAYGEPLLKILGQYRPWKMGGENIA
jgi:hypothetical protein